MGKRDFCLALACLLLASACQSEDQSSPTPFPDREGEVLLARLQCLACHGATEDVAARIPAMPAPRLEQVGGRVAESWIAATLQDGPSPDSRMPHLLGQLPESEREAVQEELVHFLSSQGGPFVAAPTRQEDWREGGQELFDRLGCRACHAEGLDRERLSRKTGLQELAEFLSDPLPLWPSGEMPDLMLSDKESLALAAWILDAQYQAGPSETIRIPGLLCEVFEPDISPVVVADAIEGEPAEVTVAATVGVEPATRDDDFGIRLRGELHVPEPRSGEMFVESDDGSRLSLNGEELINNDNLHSQHREAEEVELDAGYHGIEITMFEAGGDAYLDAGWGSADAEQVESFRAEQLSHLKFRYSPIAHEPFVPDAAKAERGRQHFARLRCAACHPLPGVEPASSPPFADLRSLDEGCLSETPGPGIPDFRLTSGQRELLRNLLRHQEELSTPLPPRTQVDHELARLRCDSCHSYAKRGGPSRDIKAFFVSDADLGEEGRIPPDLTEVGPKLTPDWLGKVLFEDGRIRPYMHTRMPRFGKNNLQRIYDAWQQDAAESSWIPPTPIAEQVMEEAEVILVGRDLVGTGGFSCITCHTFGGHPSLGVPAADLQTTAERLRPGWFQRWMEEPSKLRRGTRMPTYFENGRSALDQFLDGDQNAQIASMWTYFARGSDLLPPGLIADPADYDLTPVDAPIYCGVFAEDLSARVLAIGFPEQVHGAFDQHHVRLAMVWAGEFLNVEGTWKGRGGELEVPASEQVITLPDGPTFAMLPSLEAPWPEESGQPAGWRMLGHDRDAEGRPTFRYRHEFLLVEETLQPQYVPGHGTLTRQFRVSASQARWYARVIRSNRIVVDGNHFVTEEGVQLRVFGATAQARDCEVGQELLLELDDGESNFSVEMQW